MSVRLMTSLALVVVVVVVVVVIGVGEVEGQQRGWFSPRRTVTKVLELRSLVITSTPSSCVAVQTSLPPCRHIRQLGLAPSKPTRIYATQAPGMEMQMQPVRLEPSSGGMLYSGMGPAPTAGHSHGPADHHMDPALMAEQNQQMMSQPNQHLNQNQNQGGLGWLFGVQDFTVTNTVVRPFTKTVTDPNTIVTFSVKGCQPSRLPFDLGPCEDGPLDKDEAELAKGPAVSTPAPAGTPSPPAAVRGARLH